MDKNNPVVAREGKRKRVSAKKTHPGDTPGVRVEKNESDAGRLKIGQD